jgi:DNA invertase Pin-like site-specific DNA recombinase
VTLETLERLQHLGVGFVSISEQMDFTTPIGKVVLATLAAFVQYFSDNLATEVKKGKAERKAQGLYNGVLPFGLKKNSQGIPVPDPTTYQGLLLAFDAAAKGSSDREAAVLLNEQGHRTTGNRGRNLFSKDSVRVLLQNRFYLGELPDGKGGWLSGAHEPVLDDALFLAAQEARERRTSNPLPVRARARVYSLSGMLRCHHCGGTLHLHRDRGRARAYCYQARQGTKCPQRSTFLTTYEAQVVEYLSTFTIPANYREQLAIAQARSQTAVTNADEQRRRCETQLANARTLFELGDLTKAEYVDRRDRLQRQIEGLRTDGQVEAALERAAAFLVDLPGAGRAADDVQRNALARLLFKEVRLKDEWVVAVLPQPSFAPFFDWDCQARRLSGGSDGGRGRVLELFRPRRMLIPDLRARASGTRRWPSRQAPSVEPRYRVRARRLTSEQERSIQALAAMRSLRELAAEFGISHETIRTVLRHARLG